MSSKLLKKGWFRFVALLILLLLIRIFAFECYQVSSSSMEKTLMTNDWVLVSKVAYGARLPASVNEIPFGLLFASIFNSTNKNLWDYSHYSRLPKIQTINRYEVVLLKNPQNLLGTYTKRVVGMPGERIICTSDSIFLNGGTLKGSLGSIRLSSCKTQENRQPNGIIIPKKGLVINVLQLDSTTFNLVRRFESPSIRREKNGLYISNVKITSYTFKMDYYFAMGDNRFKSRDSRWFGVVPESCMLGKVIFNLSKFTPVN
jgi:signal peptidase I